MTMGVDLASPPLPPLSLSESDFNCGGQSTDVGGQLSMLPEPDEDPGGEQPAPAPKSPAVVQSAFAIPTAAAQPISEKAAAAMHIRAMLIL
jgi:hypothetical protein